MRRYLTTVLLLMTFTPVHAEGVVLGGLQEAQAQKMLEPLEVEQSSCPKTLLGTESMFFCARTAERAQAFRAAINATTKNLKPVSPWASFTDGDDQQRSFLYKDGFMTVTYFPAEGAAGEHLIVVQYAMPRD